MILTPLSPEFPTAGAILGTSSSGAWTSANDPLAIPFRLSRAAVVDQLGWFNGTAAGGNVDVGIYTSAWVRLVSTGSTLGTGNSAWQFVNVTDTPLEALKTYYVVMSRDNTTANRARLLGVGATAPAVALCGGQDSATDAFPLPDPLTNMAAAATFITIPVVAVACKAPF